MEKIIAQNKEHLKKLILECVNKNTNKCSLNHIDSSLITDMSYLFSNSYFEGDISQWDVSRVKLMDSMFAYCQFNGNISLWDVGQVESMEGMFYRSEFNNDISGWDVSRVEEMTQMFAFSQFKGDLSQWNTKNLRHTTEMFRDCPCAKPWWATDDYGSRQKVIAKYIFREKLEQKLPLSENKIKKNKI